MNEIAEKEKYMEKSSFYTLPKANCKKRVGRGGGLRSHSDVSPLL